MKALMMALFFSLAVQAAASPLDFDTLARHGLGQTVPQVFLFNRAGLVARAGGGQGNPYDLLNSIATKADKIPHLPGLPDPDLMHTLQSLAGDAAWAVEDKGLVVVLTMDPSAENCAICDQVEDYLRKIRALPQGPALQVLQVKQADQPVAKP